MAVTMNGVAALVDFFFGPALGDDATVKKTSGNKKEIYHFFNKNRKRQIVTPAALNLALPLNTLRFCAASRRAN